MSIIAVKINDKEILIASDSQSTLDNNSKILSSNKIYQITDDFIIGVVGRAKFGNLIKMFYNSNSREINSCEDVLNFFFEFRKWAVSEMDCGQEIHDNFEAIIITNKKVYTFNDFTVSEITNYDAIGSGQHIARALLDIGIVIDKVVAQVCKFDLYCGGEVKVVVIKK